MSSHLTPEFVNGALSNRTWDFGNDVLYKLCEENPDHTRDDIIIAKILLIGRVYAAAIERRRATDDIMGDAFYETKVGPMIRNEGIDEWFRGLRTSPTDDVATILEVHKKLMDLFRKITGLEKRSLASKYLHFHFRDRFYIFDTRASKAVSELTLRIGCLPVLRDHDAVYARFFLRCQKLNKEIETFFCRSLTPRELDKVLLKQAA